MKNKVLVLTICGLFILSGCAKSPKLSDGKEVVASLNGKDITAEELYDSMKKDHGTSALVSIVDKYIVSKEITDDETFKEKAEIQIQQYKVSYGDQWQDFLKYYNYSSEEDLKEDLVFQLKSEELAKRKIKEDITESELKKYYEDNIATELTVKHILIKPDVDKDATSTEKTEAETKALEKAKELIKKLNEGADFETLAKENSDDTGSASNGGLITGVNKADFDANFYKAALELKDNEYTKEPVKSQFGYHIIYTVNRTEADTYENIKDTLYDKVIDKKMANDSNITYRAWGEIRKSYNIDIVDTSLKNYYDAAMNNIK